MMKFGSMTKNSCNILLNDFLNKNSIPRESNMFYELFLQDSKGNFIDVPVLIRNLELQD
jgi:hypothetical protein